MKMIFYIINQSEIYWPVIKSFTIFMLYRVTQSHTNTHTHT